MAAQSAALSSQRLVSRTGKPQRGPTQRKTRIVALARKLLVALWKFVTAGVVIEGVTIKVA
jgi:transposase